jgi:catechol 2,3-dioxygenase-like lactoylglutathione lyase family enzyme
MAERELTGAQESVLRYWEYSFDVRAAENADPALAVLVGAWMPGRLRLTFRVPQFAAFRDGLAGHGLELCCVTRRPAGEGAGS